MNRKNALETVKTCLFPRAFFLSFTVLYFKNSKVFYGVTLFMHEKVKDCEQGYSSFQGLTVLSRVYQTRLWS